MADRSVVWVVALVAVAKLALHLVTNGQYGYHRDELYYVASGNHPALGYVDYPPITPLLARLDVLLLGNSPWALRLAPALVGSVLVILVTLIAVEFGGGRRARILTAIATGTSALLVGTNWLFQTVTFDELWWIAGLYVFVRILRGGPSYWWLVLGLVLGLGLETKWTILGLGFGLAVALLTTRARSELRTRWPWLGLAVAALLFVPNLVWQQVNGWPTLEYLRTHNSVIQSAGAGASLNFDSGGVLAFLAFQPLLIGIVTLPLFVMGFWWLLRDPRFRPLGVAALVTYTLFLLVGKAYYPGPLFPVVLAAGCVQLANSFSLRVVRGFGIAMLVQGLVLLPLGVPVVPESSLAQVGMDQFRKDFADTVGWPQLVAQIASAYNGLDASERASAVIVAQNYGEAGALDVYGPALGLPRPLSPHLTYWYWKPPVVTASVLITVGFSESAVRSVCPEAKAVATVAPVSGVRNEEVGRPIIVCRNPSVALDTLWPQLRSFS